MESASVSPASALANSSGREPGTKSFDRILIPYFRVAS